MPSATTIRVTDSSGNFLFETAEFLEIGNNPGLHYVLSCGLVGELTVTLPPDFNDLLLLDGRIHVMRSVNGAPAQREGESCYLIRKWVYANDYTTVFALHANHILWRRIAAWGWHTRAQETGSSVTADDTIKDGGGSGMWYDNFAAGAGAGGAGREDGGNSTQVDISAYVSMQADLSAAPVVYQQWYWQNIGDAIQNICAGSFTAGTYLVAEIVAPTESTLELRTYTGQRGVDRTFASGSGLLFSETRGNLANALLTVDRTEEVTCAIATGPTRDSGTSIRSAIDTTRIGESVLNRIEALIDDSSGTNTDINAVQADANAGVRAGRPVIFASAELQETDQCVRGVQFDYGDVVTVDVQGIQYDMRIDVLEVTLQGGVETTKVSFYVNQ